MPRPSAAPSGWKTLPRNRLWDLQVCHDRVQPPPDGKPSQEIDILLNFSSNMVSPGQTTITAGFGSQFWAFLHSEMCKIVPYEVKFALSALYWPYRPYIGPIGPISALSAIYRGARNLAGRAAQFGYSGRKEGGGWMCSQAPKKLTRYQ